MAREPYLVRTACGDSALVHEVVADSWACTASLAIFWDAEGVMVKAFGLANLIDITIPAPDPDKPAEEPAAEVNVKEEPSVPLAPERRGTYL